MSELTDKIKVYGLNKTEARRINRSFHATISVDDFDKLSKINEIISEFAKFSGVDEDNVNIDYSTTPSYYDSYELEIELSVFRQETDEEFQERRTRIEKEARIAKAKKAADTKLLKKKQEERDLAEWERLKKKFGE